MAPAKGWIGYEEHLGKGENEVQFIVSKFLILLHGTMTSLLACLETLQLQPNLILFHSCSN